MVCFKKYTSVRNVGMVRLTLQGTGMEYAYFYPKKSGTVR